MGSTRSWRLGCTSSHYGQETSYEACDYRSPRRSPATGQPAGVTQPSIPPGRQMSSNPCVYIYCGGGDHKTAGLYVRLYGKRPRSVTAGLGCGVDCMPVLSVTTAPLRLYMRQLWCCVNEPYVYLFIFYLKPRSASGTQYADQIADMQLPVKYYILYIYRLKCVC